MEMPWNVICEFTVYFRTVLIDVSLECFKMPFASIFNMKASRNRKLFSMWKEGNGAEHQLNTKPFLLSVFTDKTSYKNINQVFS